MKAQWQPVGGFGAFGSVTEVLRVPGGMVLRTTTTPEMEGEPRAIAMVFVPAPLAEIEMFLEGRQI